MIFKATLANRAHPEYGQATIPFPITASEYDISLALLRQLGIGSPITQDCRVEGISGSYPILILIPNKKDKRSRKCGKIALGDDKDEICVY